MDKYHPPEWVRVVFKLPDVTGSLRHVYPITQGALADDIWIDLRNSVDMWLLDLVTNRVGIQGTLPMA
jgi:hypothetical protein